MTSANRAIVSTFQSSLLFKSVKIETPNGTHLITPPHELKIWEDYTQISAKQRILKLWQNYKLRIRLRNLAKTAKIREELFYLPAVGKHYLDAKSSFESDVRKTSESESDSE